MEPVAVLIANSISLRTHNNPLLLILQQGRYYYYLLSLDSKNLNNVPSIPQLVDESSKVGLSYPKTYVLDSCSKILPHTVTWTATSKLLCLKTSCTPQFTVSKTLQAESISDCSSLTASLPEKKPVFFSLPCNNHYSILPQWSWFPCILQE